MVGQGPLVLRPSKYERGGVLGTQTIEERLRYMRISPIEKGDSQEEFLEI